MSTAPKPLRIKRITLTDFRAFPGPAPVTFNLDEKNLLVYGENGAGKSSLFHALREFFSCKPLKKLVDHKNVFSGEPDTACSVEIEFNDGKQSAKWHIGGTGTPRERHPTQLYSGNDPRVVQTALRRACIDYRALLDTNYLHGDKEINLFRIAVEHVLADFPATISGGTTRTIGELWREAEVTAPPRHTSVVLARIIQACADFNTGFRQALKEVDPHIGALLQDLLVSDVSVAPFTFAGLTYNRAYFKRDRKIDGDTLTAKVTFKTHQVARPQHFLNEARLSAFGLAFYLAGRLACTPPAMPGELKLLVLDDVLIGLDHSNRLPVLEVLRKYFFDWQIILMTHDRVWYEMAREHLPIVDDWKSVEVYEGMDETRGIPTPILRVTDTDSASAALTQARAFLEMSHIPAAASYTRTAFEIALSSFCAKRSVAIPYLKFPKTPKAETFLNASENWIQTNINERGHLLGVFERVRMFRSVVLNPYCHSSPSNIARGEVKGAIAAVAKLLSVVNPKKDRSATLFGEAQSIIRKQSPSKEEQEAALAYLRAAFLQSLRAFCERKQVALAYQEKPVDCATLWQAVMTNQTTLFPTPHNGFPAQINVERSWLVDPISANVLENLKLTDLQRIIGVIAPAGASGIVLDSL